MEKEEGYVLPSQNLNNPYYIQRLTAASERDFNVLEFVESIEREKHRHIPLRVRYYYQAVKSWVKKTLSRLIEQESELENMTSNLTLPTLSENQL